MVQERINVNSIVMKVMCIQEGKKRTNVRTGESLPIHRLVIGHIYNVVDERYVPSLKMSMYELEEFKPDPKIQVFGKHLFAPLSDIDETELVNEREEVYG